MILRLVIVALAAAGLGLSDKHQDSKHRRHQRCGGLNHAHLTRPCLHNDTMCGHWTGKWWNPHSCAYQNITSEEARRCVGNRTIACVGDSQIRDLCVRIAYFLMGINASVDMHPVDKFDALEMVKIGSVIGDYPFWKKNVPGNNFNGYVFPKQSLSLQNNWDFQVQVWSLYRKFFVDEQVIDVLTNRVADVSKNVRPIDFVLWNHGLHDYGFFDKPPYGPDYYAAILEPVFLQLRKEAVIPVVWMSMNGECGAKIPEYRFEEGQHIMVEETNKYVNARFLQEGIPYWDADAVLRVPMDQRCILSADGVHVNTYVDVMRAKMFFNHLCDNKMNWRGDTDAHFV